MGIRLHELLARALAVTSPNLHTDRDDVNRRNPDIPMTEEGEQYLRQVRALINLVYPPCGADQSLLSSSSPFSIV